MTKTFIIRDFQGYRTVSGWVLGSAGETIILATPSGAGEEPSTVLIERSTIVGEFPTAA